MIYLVQASDRPAGPIKIGMAADHLLTSRIQQLRTSSPDDLQLLVAFAGDEGDETALHKRFAGAHIRREWFSATPALLAFVAEQQELERERQAFPAVEPPAVEEQPPLTHLESAARSLQTLLKERDPSRTWLVEVRD